MASKPTIHHESDSDHVVSGFSVGKVVCDVTSAVQRIRIFDTPAYGRVLVLDDETQSSALDQALYHETLVHPAMTAHPDPRHVLIIGGGEFATAREVLKYPGVECVVMVDYDGTLLEMAPKYLPEWCPPSVLADPRFRAITADAYLWLVAMGSRAFDVVIMDLCDPEPDDPTDQINRFYSREFFQDMRLRHLTDQGVLMVQAGSYRCAGGVHDTIRDVFEAAHTQGYREFIPSFTGMWGFVVAQKGLRPTRVGLLPTPVTCLTDRKIDWLLSLDVFDAPVAGSLVPAAL